MRIKKTIQTRIFEVCAYSILTFTALISVIPFIMVVSGSFSTNRTVIVEGYGLLPKDFTLESYKVILENSKQILRAYGVTIFCTLVGTTVGLLLTTLTGYVLSRKEFRYRNTISFLIYFTSIFGGGMIPWYYMYTGILGLKGTLTALWLPAILAPFYIILMRTFVTSSLPEEITDAAKIDGAGHVTILLRIAMPLLKPALATIGLFMALGYWNDWYRSSLFSTKMSNWELQFYLYNMLNTSEAAKGIAAQAGITLGNLPTETMKLAMSVIVTGPILLLYPFVQKYFVSGITIGAVKG